MLQFHIALRDEVEWPSFRNDIFYMISFRKSCRIYNRFVFARLLRSSGCLIFKVLYCCMTQIKHQTVGWKRVSLKIYVSSLTQIHLAPFVFMGIYKKWIKRSVIHTNTYLGQRLFWGNSAAIVKNIFNQIYCWYVHLDILPCYNIVTKGKEGK